MSQNTHDTPVAEIWEAHRGYLLNIAYRMLGSFSDAEDIVQEAFDRLLRAERESLDEVRGWLVVVVSRLCLDQLRSARVRREAYVGTWLPEPVIPAGDVLGPEDRVVLDDTVRMALLVVLDRLSPAERVAFVLHDVFQYSFEDIARIMKRAPAACRQLASRARRSVQDQGAQLRGEIDPAEAERVTERFITAAATGSLHGLLDVLDPEAVVWADTGGLLPAPRRPAIGSRRVATLLLAWLGDWNATLIAMPINGGPGAVVIRDGEVSGAIGLVIDAGVITDVHAVGNPQKLAYVRSVLGDGQLGRSHH